MPVPSIVVHQFPPVLQMQPSPFGLKLETWLKMNNLSYECRASFTRMGPKDKVPFAEIDGQIIGDSEFIIDRIDQKLGEDRIPRLSDKDEARTLVIRRLVEEHLYFILLHSRWVDEKGWTQFSPLVFGHLPPIVRTLVPRKIRKMVRKALIAQGISRHSDEEIYGKGAKDLKALSVLLDTNLYFHGQEPGIADASAYGLLANIRYSPIRSPLLDSLEAHDSLMAFCDRMRSGFWPHSPRGGGEEFTPVA